VKEPKLTPLIKQYQDIKKQYPDCILFFRLGDFYEMFGEDARISSKILNIALTSRQGYPMCGVPHHASIPYIEKLIRKGLKVAICEQLEDPKKSKGLVKRDVVRVITPGTVIEENILDGKTNNFIGSVYFENEKSCGFVYGDISTGELYLTEEYEDGFNFIMNEISSLSLREIIVNDRGYELLKGKFENVYLRLTDFSELEGKEKLKEILGVENLIGYELEDKNLSLKAFNAFYRYLIETQKREITNIVRINFYRKNDRLYLDDISIKNLEILKNVYDGSKRGTLIDVLDKTKTNMGARLLRKWLLAPLIDVKKIKERQEKVLFFYSNRDILERTRDILDDILDLERIVSKVSFGSANAKDLVSLKRSLKKVKELKQILPEFNINSLDDVYDLLDSSIVENPPASLNEGGIIKEDYDERVKRLNQEVEEAKKWLLNLEERERKRTGIQSLKVGYNSVFGYYIEVTKPNLKLVPSDYIRKQTLVNSERFITPELKEKESIILSANERRNALEYEIFVSIREKVKERVKEILELSNTISEIDVYSTFAFVSLEYNYTKPEVDDGDLIEIIEGRHPVVERNVRFTPNDTLIDRNENQILIITGPNMAGKSVYIKQVALIVIMAQIGSFVPAEKARIGVVDRIFTRIGAGEDISRGLSTFMVEMTEVANILNNATEKSLIIMDEVGRGTSTFDGISIAWACVEYLNKIPLKPRVLFATHFFELTELQELLNGVKNYNVSVREYKGKIIFLHKIVEGATDKSYGIHVASLSGIPKEVLERAKEILRELEEEGRRKVQREKPEQLDFFLKEEVIKEKIKRIDINNITPIEAINILAELKKDIEK